MLKIKNIYIILLLMTSYKNMSCCWFGYFTPRLLYTHYFSK